MKTGIRYDRHDDCWTRWVLLDRRRLSRAEVREHLRNFPWPCRFPTPGGRFHALPRIRRQGHRILMKQFGGYDV